MILPWHQSAFQKLEAMVDQNHLPHALLISGAQQIGKFELAQQLILKLTGDKRILDDNAKHALETPASIRRSHYPNLIYCRDGEINETTKKKSKEIRINQVRDFCEALNKTANSLQIGLLFYADYMNVSAANSLLKTLEEPRENTLIILLAHNPKNLTATILSRCQHVYIPPAYDQNTQSWLKQHMSENQTQDFDIAQLLESAHGVPAKVLDELSSDGFMQYQHWQNQLLDIAIHPLNVNQLKDLEGDEIQVLKCLQNLLVECIKLKALGQKSASVELNQITSRVKAEFLFKLLDDIYHAIALSKTSVNMKLLLDNVLTVWSHITHLKRYPSITNTY